MWFKKDKEGIHIKEIGLVDWPASTDNHQIVSALQAQSLRLSTGTNSFVGPSFYQPFFTCSFDSDAEVHRCQCKRGV